MESKEQLQHYLQEIEAWEKDQGSAWFWEKLARLPFKFLDKLTPKFLQEKLGQLVNLLVDYVQTGGNLLTSTTGTLKTIERKTGLEIESIEELHALPIERMIVLSEDLKKNRANFATVQGATTGFGGLFTIIADIPLVIGNALKSLQEIAIIHGYDPRQKEERVFIVKCLQYVFADVVGKEAILKELTAIQLGQANEQNMIAQIQGWREVFITYSEQFGLKKLMQMIPIIGMIFGAITNKSMIEDIVDTGMMLYRKRRVYERLQSLEP
ncbi:MAG: EcsC family protein [Lysinibacillus sp.]